MLWYDLQYHVTILTNSEFQGVLHSQYRNIILLLSHTSMSAQLSWVWVPAHRFKAYKRPQVRIGTRHPQYAPPTVKEMCWSVCLWKIFTMIWRIEYCFAQLHIYLWMRVLISLSRFVLMVFVVLKLSYDCRASYCRLSCDACASSDILQSERTYICSDTGSLMDEPHKRFEEYQGWVVCCIGHWARQTYMWVYYTILFWSSTFKISPLQKEGRVFRGWGISYKKCNKLSTTTLGV